MARPALARQIRHPHFAPTTAPWKVNQTAWTAPPMRLYQKQLYSSHEWETVASPHNYHRFQSPGEPGHQLKSAAQFDGQWAPQYQLETLRQTGISPQYREYVPGNPFWRDIYYEWLHRNILDDHPGHDQAFSHNYTRVAETLERAPYIARQIERSAQTNSNLDERRGVKDELRQERFEEYMRRRAIRNKQLGIDKYGIWNKKTLAYLKKLGDY
eukprot:gene11996-18530_t